MLPTVGGFEFTAFLLDGSVVPESEWDCCSARVLCWIDVSASVWTDLTNLSVS